MNVLHVKLERERADNDRAAAAVPAVAPPALLPVPTDISLSEKEAKVDTTLGSGSFEGISISAAQQQNLGMAVGFMAEGSKWLEWLMSVKSTNRSIATELHERFLYKRTTVDGQRNFKMPFPYFGFYGNVHLEDIAPLFLESDELGIRGRSVIFSVAPVFHRLDTIREANASLRNEGPQTLDLKLRNVFLPVRLAHCPEFAGAQHFVWRKGYPFRVYKFADNEAYRFFNERFDKHTKMQAEAWCVNHELSKYQGKLKCKHARHALNFHNLLQARAPVSYQGWSTSVSLTALKCGYEMGDYCEKIFATVKKYLGGIQEEHEQSLRGQSMTLGRSGAAGQGGAGGVRAALVRLLSSDALYFEFPTVKPFLMHIKGICGVALNTEQPLFNQHFLLTHKNTERFIEVIGKHERLRVVQHAMALLHMLKLSYVSVSTNIRSVLSLWLVKQPFDFEDEKCAAAIQLLQTFSVEPANYQAATRAQHQALPLPSTLEVPLQMHMVYPGAEEVRILNRLIELGNEPSSQVDGREVIPL